MQSAAAEILCIPRLHIRRFSVFGTLLFILACTEGGCAGRQPAVRSPLALTSRARQTPSSSSDAAKRLDQEAQRLLKDMQKQSARSGSPAGAAPGSVGTAGRIGDIGSAAASTMGAGSPTEPPGSLNEVGVGTEPGASGELSVRAESPAARTSPSSGTALLAAVLAALGAAAAAGVTLLMRRRA
jgi:hypothetical protein